MNNKKKQKRTIIKSPHARGEVVLKNYIIFNSKKLKQAKEHPKNPSIIEIL
jgi:hypothetical protein